MLELARAGRGVARDFVRNLDRRTRSADRGNADDQLGPALVHCLQSLADVGESDAALRLRREALAVVTHVHGKLSIDDLRADLQCAAFRLRLETVLDRVLDQRLQHHGWEHRRFQAFGDVDDRSQALIHSNGHYFQERARQVQLLTECRPTAFAHLRHRRAQVADQALLHFRRPLGVGLDQLINARERVEQEMRLDLRLQCFHPCFDDRALELLGFRAFRRFAGGKLGPTLAAGDDLDDERRDDQHQHRHRMLQNSREHQRQQGHEQQLLPRHDGEPIEEAPPDHGARVADLVQRLPNSGTPHDGAPLACVAACC